MTGKQVDTRLSHISHHNEYQLLLEQIDTVLDKVCKTVIEPARQTGTTVVTWRDGNVVKLTDEAERKAANNKNNGSR